MISADAALRTHTAIERLGRSSLDAEAFRTEAIAQLQRTIPFTGWYCSIEDPTSLLPAWTVAEGPPQHFWKDFWRRYLQMEEPEPLAHRVALLRRGPRHVRTLSEPTDAQPSRSLGWQELMRSLGIGDELHVELVLDGTCWGSLYLYRSLSEGPFTLEEQDLMQALVGPLATALRAALINAPPTIQEIRDGPGLLLLGPDLSLAATSAAGERWLTRLGGSPELMPHVVVALAARLRALELGRVSSDLTPRACIRTLDGDWLVAHATRLSGSRGDEIAIIMEPAAPGDLAPMLIHGYGLSPREKEVVLHVERGESTAQIANSLVISPHTVQDHLKGIFDKVGVRSRRELASALAARPASFAI
jgi:DNA-binding CsgD family transcriptional regulator/GAF domain-containing protein